MLKCTLNVRRAEEKLTQKELSSILDIRLQTISDMENGKSRSLSVDTIEKLCDYFNCDIGDLWEYIPDK